MLSNIVGNMKKYEKFAQFVEEILQMFEFFGQTLKLYIIINFRWSDQGAFTGDMHSIEVKFYSQVHFEYYEREVNLL